MKKIIGSTLAAFALTFSLMACGGQQNASTQTPEDSVNNSSMSVDTTSTQGSTMDTAGTGNPNNSLPPDTAR